MIDEHPRPRRGVTLRAPQRVARTRKPGWTSSPRTVGWKIRSGLRASIPKGKGHHGREAISKFYDMTIANADKLEFLIDDSLVCGNENVNIGKIRTTIGGSIIDAEGVFVYRVNDDGKIASLRAFWEVDRAMKTARKA